MKKNILVFVTTVLLISCKQSASDAIPVGNDFYFENPQPIHDSELNSIPNKYLGIFINSDSVFLNIKKDVIFTEIQTRYKIHKNEIDSLKEEIEIFNDKYIVKKTKEIFYIKPIGDSIEMVNKSIDTIFAFSNSQKAKRINGILVLNEQDSIFWKIKFISLNKNQLIIKNLYSNEDLKRMDSITKIHSKMIDSTSFIIKPIRSEFNKFLKLKEFGFNQEYRKISN